MPLVLDVLTAIDERSAAASARQLERQFEEGGREAGQKFGVNLAQGLTAGFQTADFESLTGVLASSGMAAKAASHGSAIGLAFAGGIVTAAAGGLVDLGVKVGETFEKINRDITLHTAASGKALEEMKSQADALVGSLDSSAKNVGNDWATLATRLQMSGDPLKELVGNVTMLRDRMGDFNVGALAGGLANMGVSGAQANDTLASLAATVQRTNIPMAELVTDLAANSDLFKDMHLTAGQAANMLGEISAKGVPAATAVMGLQMGMKTAKDQGEDFNTFIRRVADSLDYYGRTGNEVAAEQLSLAVGGPRKWADLETAARSYLDTVQQGAAVFAGHGEDLTTLGEQTETLANKWTHVRNAISEALAPPGLSVTDEVGQKMDGLISFINAHQNDLRQLFETSLHAIGDVVEGVGQIAVFLGRHPALIRAVEVAFGTWAAIRGVDFVLTGLESLGAWLVGAPAVAAASAAGVDAAMTGMAATTTAAAGEMALAFGPLMAELPVIATEAEVAGTAIATSMTAADGAIVALNATLDTALASLAAIAVSPGVVVLGGLAALFGASIAFGSATGQEATPDYTSSGAAALGPDGKPLLGPDGQPLTGGMGRGTAQGPGTGRFAPGQGPDVGGRAGPTLPGATVAPGGGDTGGPPGDLLTPGDLDPAKKGPRLPTAPEVPYGAGYGAPPGPGESAEQYSKQQDILEKRHAIDEATARLNQLEHDNNATADDIQKAKNALLKAQSDGYKAELDQTQKHTADMEQLGAKIDKDFGISKGLPGIAENLTKFLANLAFAPAFGAMSGAQAGLGYPGGQGLGGAKGLLGMAGLSGAFGQQFTVGGGGGATTGGGAPGGGHGGGLGGLAARLGAGGAGANPAQAAGAIQPPSGATAAPTNLSGNEAILHQAMLSAGFGEDQWPALRNLEMHEAGFNPTAANPSGAYGMGQFMPYTWGAYGTSGKTSDPGLQSQDMMKYIAGRYGNPNAAWAQYFQHAHGEGSYAAGGAVGYYAEGGTLGGTPSSGATGAAAGAAAGVPAGTDTVPAMLSPGEHVLTTQDVQAMGGQQGVYNFRAALQGTSAAGIGPRPSTAGGAGATQIGGIGAPQGLGSGFTVTGGGLIGVAESIPATIANMAIQAGMSAAAVAATGGATEDLNYAYFGNGGAVRYFADGGAGEGDAGAGGGAAGAGAGGASPGGGAPGAAAGAVGAPAGGGSGTGAGGGGAPGGSVVSAAIGIGIQEANEAISKGGQAVGALVGGAQQTFGLQQFAGSQLAQTGWLSRIVGGVAGAQPQLPNMAGKGSGNASPEGVAGMTPMGETSTPIGIPGPPPPSVMPATPPSGAPAHGNVDSGVISPGAGADGAAGPLYTHTPDSVTGLDPGGPSGGGAADNLSGNSSSSSGAGGPAVYIEHYHDEGNSNSAGQDIGRHVEASYAAQATPGAR